MRADYDGHVAGYNRFVAHDYSDTNDDDDDGWLTDWFNGDESPNNDITIIIESPDSAITTGAFFVSLILPLLYLSL